MTARRILFALAILGLSASTLALAQWWKAPRADAEQRLVAGAIENGRDIIPERSLEIPVSVLVLAAFGVILLALAAAQRSASLAASLPLLLLALPSVMLGFLYHLQGPPWRSSGPLGASYFAMGAFFVVATALPMPRLSHLFESLVGDFRALATRLALLGGGLVVVGLAGIWVVHGHERQGEASADLRQWYLSQPRFKEAPLVVDEAVTVIEFVDYQCPPCKTAFSDYQQVLQAFERTRPGAIRFRSLHFPALFQNL